GGFLCGLVRLARIWREQRLRFRLEAARLVELGLDAVPPIVDAFDHAPVHAEIAEHANENDEGDGDPEFSFEHWGFSALEYVAHGFRNVAARRRAARQPVDNGGGRVACVSMHVRLRRRALRGNALLRVGPPGSRLAGELLTAVLGP